MIKWDEVVTVEATQLEKENSLRAQRDAALRETDWMVIRHRDELEMGTTNSLEGGAYERLIAYRQALRDWTNTPDWTNTAMPMMPGAAPDLLKTGEVRNV